MSNAPIIVCGAGQAGLQIIDSLRRGGYDADLVLIGDETALPYQRPPLSKQYMSGEMADERLLFRPAEYYAKQNVEVMLNASVSAIDASAKTITVNGQVKPYSKLALTTGASVRKIPIPGAELPGVYYLRSLDDARAIAAKLATGPQRLIAIGGGFIGLEIAASARELGHEVTVVEGQSRLMARAVAPLVSQYYCDLHRARGVEILLDHGVSEISASSNESLSVRLDDGTELSGDLIVVGIGSVPHSAIAESAGIDCNDGILVDEFAQTSAADIVAAGDCTRHKNTRVTGLLRLESVQNAVDQAKVAAASLLGTEKAYDQVPWFWSDQFDAKLQMVGVSNDHDRHVLRGDIDSGAFSAFYFKDNVLVGIDSVNRPADHLIGRKLIAAGVEVPDAMIADLEQNLKTLL